MTPAYIHVDLCDHDFTDLLEQAVRIVYGTLGGLYPADVFQRRVVGLTYELYLLRCSYLNSPDNEAARVLDYLKNSTRVEYSQKPPTKDQDCSSVAVKCDGPVYIWRY